MDVREQVLALVKEKGPIIPNDVYQSIGKDLLTTSAVLSELSSNKQVRISNVKKGGSPLYFITGQEDKLQDFASLLQEKDRIAFDMLKENKVLRDKTQTPVIRVALRQIKDFAIPVNVQNGPEVELFWKWYLESNESVEPVIRKALGILEEPEQIPEPIQEKTPEPIPKKIEPKPVQKEPEQQTLTQPKKKTVSQTEFLSTVLDFFNENDIKVHDQEIIKKNEIDFVIELPSQLGNIKFYCKAKSKKRSGDADLSSAFMQGQFKKLPVLYLSDGELTKKAKEMLDSQFAGITVRRM